MFWKHSTNLNLLSPFQFKNNFKIKPSSKAVSKECDNLNLSSSVGEAVPDTDKSKWRFQWRPKVGGIRIVARTTVEVTTTTSSASKLI